MINTPFMYAGGSSLANSNTGQILPYFNAGGNMLDAVTSIFQKSVPKTAAPQTAQIIAPTATVAKPIATNNCNCENCECDSKKTMMVKALALLAAGVAVGYFLIK